MNRGWRFSRRTNPNQTNTNLQKLVTISYKFIYKRIHITYKLNTNPYILFHIWNKSNTLKFSSNLPISKLKIQEIPLCKFSIIFVLTFI